MTLALLTLIAMTWDASLMEWPARNQSSRTRRYFFCNAERILCRALACVGLGSGAPAAEGRCHLPYV